MRTTVYIDGFNLYFGCLKKTTYKWLDLYSLFEELLDSSTTELKIKYFTAKIKPTSDPQAPFRQQKYIEALEAHCPNIEIIYGSFTKQKKFMRRVTPDVNYPEGSLQSKTARVIVFEVVLNK